MNTMAFQIRWRYLGIAVAIVAVGSGIVFGIHEYQMPGIAERVLNESRTLAASGNTGKARARYADYLSLNPGNSDAYEEYADLVLASSDSVGTVRNDSTALNLLDAAVQNGATSDETRIRLIQSAMRLKKYTMAQRMLRRMDLETLQSSEMYSADGVCELNKRRPDRAEKAFRKALQLDGTCVEAWEGLLEIEADINKDLEAAEVTADRMIAAMPAKGQSAKAWLYIRMEDFESAGNAFYAAAKQLPGEQAHAFDLANFVMRAGVAPAGDDRAMVEFAFDNLKTAYDSNVSYDVAFLLGDIAQRLRRLQESETHYRMCLERRPADAAAIGRIVEVHSLAGDFAAAEKSLEGLSSKKQHTTLKAVLKARLLADQGRFREASDTLEEVVDVAGIEMRQSVHVLLIDCLRKQQRFKEATGYGYKLLTITGNDDESRKLLVESLVDDARYDKAISQMQLVFSPEQYYAPMLTYLMNHAKKHNLQTQLQVEMEATQKYSSSASLPRIFEACQLTEAEDFTQASELLLHNAVNSPEATEYWSQWNLLQNKMVQHYAKGNMAADLHAMPSDEARIYSCIAKIKNGEIANIISLVTDDISTKNNSNKSLQLAADIIRTMAKHDADAATKLLNGVYPEFYKRLREASGFVTELTASLLFEFGEHERLVALQEYLVSNNSTVQLHAVMADLVAKRMIDGSKVVDNLSAKNDTSSEVREALSIVFQAETAVGTTDLVKIVDQLSKHVSENGMSPPVVSCALRLAAHDETVRPSMAEMGFWLNKQKPNDDYVLHLLSCGLRASRRYQESLKFSYQAFKQNQNPVYLLHASYTLWRLGRIEKSQATLKLAFKAGLQTDRLSLLDRDLLDRLLKDSEISDIGITAR